jgi:hypothetical protein
MPATRSEMAGSEVAAERAIVSKHLRFGLPLASIGGSLTLV